MDKIKCPKCGHAFELTESLAGPLVAAARAEADAQAMARVEAARKQIETEARSRAETAAREQTESLQKNLREQVDGNRELNERIRLNDEKLVVAQAAQAEAVRKQRELDDARRELDLTIERRVTEGAAAVRTEAQRVAEEAIGLRVAEREATIEGLRKALEDAQRRASQGSQQNQGEVQEVALEVSLREAFPLDAIEPVAKGVLGADCVQVVAGDCGKIIFESKRTKSWSEGWIAKLKDDQRAATADVAVIVTTVLPKDVIDFGVHEGVWVTVPRYAVNLAVVLRTALQEVSAARSAGQGLETKAGLIYGYMTGPRFKQRVQGIVEAFTTMKEDLDAERRAIGKSWAKRETQIERVLQGTVGMYGDLQAIAGRSIAEVEGLDVAQLGGSR